MASSSTPSDDIDRILKGLHAQRQSLRVEQERLRVQEALISMQISIFERTAREWAALASQSSSPLLASDQSMALVPLSTNQPTSLPTALPASEQQPPGPAADPTTEQPPASDPATEGTNQGDDARPTKKSRNDLEPPTLPTGGSCTWSYDPDSYVVFGKVASKIDPVDLEFILSVMENPSFTLVMEGLANGLDRKLWCLQGLEARTSHIVHHKFAQFVNMEENPEYLSMRLSEYFQYLRDRSSGNAHQSSNSSSSREVIDRCVYLTDFDIPQYLPTHHQDLVRNFPLKGVLPGGSFCMMSALTPECRPYMGPNLYVTPPGSYTDFHLDGFGTVDSGHLCLSGYNEVVMLRRLNTDDQKKAMEILTGTADGLKQYPHGSDNRGRIEWPTIEKIDKCRELGYRPSVFMLKPGQFVHINKGRIHAFRKMLPVELADTDCHSKLRKNIVSTDGISEETICLSIAWDWLFLGNTNQGINQEVEACLEVTSLNRARKLKSLACPETCLLFLGIEYLAQMKEERGGYPKNVLEGIFPSLQRIILNSQQIYQSIASGPVKPDQQYEVCHTNPYGNDFCCGICFKELPNSYLHCNGCEVILGKDYNICGDCYRKKLHLDCFFQINPHNRKKSSAINHVAKKTKGCRCGQRKELCVACSTCSCACDCHKVFTLRHRFMTIEDEVELVKRIESIMN